MSRMINHDISVDSLSAGSVLLCESDGVHLKLTAAV